MMKKHRYKLCLLLLSVLLCVLILSKPSRHGSPLYIFPNLRHLYVYLLHLQDNGYDVRIYAEGNSGWRRRNLIALLSLDMEYDKDIYAFYITDSGYWIGYNLSPYHKYVKWGIDFGRVYGIDEVQLSSRKKLEALAHKYKKDVGDGLFLYGSDSINTPPLLADKFYRYKMSDNAVWLHLSF